MSSVAHDTFSKFVGDLRSGSLFGSISNPNWGLGFGAGTYAIQCCEFGSWALGFGIRNLGFQVSVCVLNVLAGDSAFGISVIWFLCSYNNFCAKDQLFSVRFCDVKV